MATASDIRDGMEIVGADGVHVGAVDHMDGQRIKMKRKDEKHGQDDSHHHYLELSAIGSTEGGKLWLSADAANARQLFQEKDGSPVEHSGGGEGRPV